MPEPFFQGICFMLETWILVSFLGEFNLTFKHFICLFEVWLRYFFIRFVKLKVVLQLHHFWLPISSMKVYSWLLHVFHNTAPVAPWRGGVGTRNTAGNSGAVVHAKLSQWSTIGNKIWLSLRPRNFGNDEIVCLRSIFLRAPLIWLWQNFFFLGGIKRMTLGCWVKFLGPLLSILTTA